MIRPLYETEADRIRENKVLERIMIHTDAQALKLAKRDRLDYAMFRNGQCVALIEIKTRRIPFNQFETVMIEYSKAEAARQIAFETGLPCYLFVEWMDALGFINFAEHFDLGVGGRRDRHTEDYGLAAYYPRRKFKLIS